MGEPVKPPYKSDHNIWYTSSLFWETWKNKIPRMKFCDPVFTLYEQRSGLICFRTTFVELNDPTGYKWAIQYLGDYEHWIKLMKAPWFRAAYEHALAELYMKLKSEGVRKIQELANDETSKSALAAARYLAELHGHLNKATKGRPSKAQMDAELKNAVALVEAEDEDAERIGLTVIKGGK